jgi:hypothetical protein
MEDAYGPGLVDKSIASTSCFSLLRCRRICSVLHLPMYKHFITPAYSFCFL